MNKMERKDWINYPMFSKIAAIIVIIIAMMGALSSFFPLSLIQKINLTWIGLNLNVAIAFLLMSFSLLLTLNAQQKHKISYLANILLLVVFLVSVMNLVAFLTGDVAIDALLLQDNDPLTIKPGRMPLLAAIGFMLLSSSLLMQGRLNYLNSQIPACIVIILATFELISYIFGIRGIINFLVQSSSNIHMAFLTSLAFIALALSILLLEPSKGLPKIIMSRYLGGLIVRKITPYVILIPIIIGFLKIIGQSFGLFTIELGNVWLIIGTILILCICLLYQANWLNNLDKKRLKDEQFLKSVLENTNNVIFIKNLAGKYQLVNKQFTRITKKKKKHLIGKTDFDIFTPEFAEQFKKMDEEVAATEKMIMIEESVPLRDGIHTYLTNKFPIFDEKNDVYAIGGIAIDITEQKLAQDRFRMIIEAAPDGIIVINRKGHIILVNKRTEEMFGYSTNELLNMSIKVLMPDISEYVSMEHEDNFFNEIMSGFMGQMMELFALRKNKKYFPIEISISPILITEGTVALATIRDITSRKTIEEKNQTNLQQLKKRHRELNLLNEFGSNMQVCKRIQEAGRLIANYASHLFPDCAGSLYLTQQNAITLDLITSFNDPILKQSSINPDDCWALRIGNVHNVENVDKDIICGHNMNLPVKSPTYMCLPLFAQGNISGLFYVENLTGNKFDDLKSQEILASTFCEQIALGLSNIRLQETLREQSIRDVLTGLYNRRYLEETFERELVRVRRNGLSLTVIMFDIDHFKDFNDDYGHKAGDVLLQSLGRLVFEKMRASDIICRYGGEEFVVVLPETSIGTGWQRAEHLRKQVAEMKVIYNKVELSVTISVGVAAYPEHGEDMFDLIAAADIALYQAKKKGRDTTVIYSHE